MRAAAPALSSAVVRSARAEVLAERLPRRGVANQVLGQAVAGAEQRGQHAQELRVIAQQRHQADRPARGQVAEVRQRAIRIRRRGRLRQEHRRQPRAHQVQAVGPALGILEAQGRQRLLDVFARARGIERDRDLRAKRGRRIVEGRRDRFDRRALLRDRGVERGDVMPAQALGQARAPLELAGDALALRALLHLDPVFDVPPEAVGGDQRARLAIAEQPGDPQAVQRARRGALAQVAALAAVEQLQRLHHQLDVADAARAQLHVERPVAGCRRRRPVHRAQLADVAHHRRVDAARVDEWLQHRQQLLAERAVAGARPRAQQRLPLPGAAEGLVVALRGRERVAQRPRAPLGAQPQVDAKDRAVLGDLFDGRRDPARQLAVVLVQRALARLARVRGVEVADVDVRREVQLLAAQLAHGQHHE